MAFLTCSTVKPLVMCLKVFIFGFPVLSCRNETKLKVSLYLKSALPKIYCTVFHRIISDTKRPLLKRAISPLISVIECNMHGVFHHFLSIHYCTTASHWTLWRTNSLSRTNSLKVDPEGHWIKSDMTVM